MIFKRKKNNNINLRNKLARSDKKFCCQIHLNLFKNVYTCIK